MRYLTWISGGILLASILSAYLPGLFPLGALAAFFAFLGLYIYGKKHKKARISAWILAGAAIGFLYYTAYYSLILEPLSAYDNQTVHASVILTENTWDRHYGSSAGGVICLEGKSYRSRIYFKEKESFQSGDRIEGSFTLRTPEMGEDSAGLPGDGIFLQAFGDENIRKIPTDQASFWTFPGKVKAWSETVISWCFSQQAAPFAQALLLGDTEKLSFSQKWDMRISGISHLVAVSGLHVSVLCVLLGFLTLKNKWLSAILGVPILLFFGAVTGFSPSVVRAVIMMLLLLLARLLNRRYDPLTELSAAVTLMVLLNPLVVTSASFQLSVASVLGIFCFYKPIRGRILKKIKKQKGFLNKLRHFFAGSLSLSCASLIFVTPLTVLYFGSVSLIAPITNLLTVWLVPFLFWGILGVLGLSLISVGGAMVMGSVLSFGISFVLSVSHILAQLPMAAVFTESGWILCWVISVYILGAFFLRGPTREFLKFFSVTAVTLAAALLCSWLMPLSHSFIMRVYDVGQGQCILLQSEGRNFLVDCGGDREEQTALQVLDTLRSQGIRRLDGLILTHFDRDHVCGADELLSVMDVDRVYVPAGEKLPFDERLKPVSNDLLLSFGDSKLTIYGSKNRENSNEMGLCVLLESPKYDILITGDRSREGELELLRNHRLPRVDCLLAGHHGAKDSTSLELLSAVSPETVIISAGENNRYGHPAGETLRRLHSYGCQILRTDLNGTIIIRR